MKILFAPAHYYFSDKYGSEPYWAYQIVKKSAEFGHEVTAIVGVNDCDVNLDGYLGKVKLITIFPRKRSANVLIELCKRLIFVWYVYYYARKYSKGNKVDIIHHAFPSSPDTFSLLSIIKDKKIPFVLGPLQVPTLTGGYASFVHSNRGTYNIFSSLSFLVYRLAKPVLGFLAKITIQHATIAFANTLQAKECYENFTKKKITVIPIGIDIPNKQSKPSNSISILCTGYLTERKGHRYLVDAFGKVHKEYPAAQLIIVGNGPELGRLRQQVRQLGLTDVVIFTGFIPHSQIGKYYVKASLYVLPSLEESYGNVLLEAMSYGLPIVATNVGSVSNIIGDAGILVKPADNESLQKAIVSVLSSKHVRGSLRKKAVEQIYKYSWDEVIKKYNNIYRIAKRDKKI